MIFGTTLAKICRTCSLAVVSPNSLPWRIYTNPCNRRTFDCSFLNTNFKAFIFPVCWFWGVSTSQGPAVPSKLRLMLTSHSFSMNLFSVLRSSECMCLQNALTWFKKARSMYIAPHKSPGELSQGTVSELYRGFVPVAVTHSLRWNGSKLWMV